MQQELGQGSLHSKLHAQLPLPHLGRLALLVLVAVPYGCAALQLLCTVRGARAAQTSQAQALGWALVVVQWSAVSAEAQA